MTSAPLSTCPFVADSMITDPQHFVGRKAELQLITDKMSAVHPVSINVVGRQRIGKSSLLYHFFQTWEERVENPSRYVVIYLSLQEARCQSENGFYQAVGRQLWSRPAVLRNPSLSEPLTVKPFNRLAFSAALGNWKRQGVLPVLCLDEFGPLFRYPQEFDNGFFDNLRSLMESHVLMLVVASHRKLDFYGRRHEFTSAFFEMKQVLQLGEFSHEEVKLLLRLPASTVVGATPALTAQEQRLAQQLGGRNPFLLQLACSYLWEARQLGRDPKWAKAQFEAAARQVPRAFWKMSPQLTYFLRGVAVVVILSVIGLVVLNQAQLLEWMRSLVGK